MAKGVKGLRQLSKPEAIEAVRMQIMQDLQISQARPPPALEVQQAEKVAGLGIETETEELRKLSMSDLYARIGLGTSKRIIGLECAFDKDGIESSWTFNDPRWAAKLPSSRLGQQHPRHHQLVGVVKMLPWVLRGEGGLLADDVGLGKTLQVTMVALERMNIVERHDKMKLYDDVFGEHCFSPCAHLCLSFWRWLKNSTTMSSCPADQWLSPFLRHLWTSGSAS